MEQLPALPDLTAARSQSRLEEKGWSWQRSEQHLQSSRSGLSAQQAEPVRWWTGSPSEGRGQTALDRVHRDKEILNPTGAPARKLSR